MHPGILHYRHATTGTSFFKSSISSSSSSPPPPPPPPPQPLIRCWPPRSGDNRQKEKTTLGRKVTVLYYYRRAHTEHAAGAYFSRRQKQKRRLFDFSRVPSWMSVDRLHRAKASLTLQRQTIPRPRCALLPCWPPPGGTRRHERTITFGCFGKRREMYGRRFNHFSSCPCAVCFDRI